MVWRLWGLGGGGYLEVYLGVFDADLADRAVVLLVNEHNRIAFHDKLDLELNGSFRKSLQRGLLQNPILLKAFLLFPSLLRSLLLDLRRDFFRELEEPLDDIDLDVEIGAPEVDHRF